MADKPLFYIVFALIAIGVIFAYSLGTYSVVYFEYDPYHFVVRQALFAFVALLIMWWLSGLAPEVWLHRIGLALFLGGALLMAMMPFMPESYVSEVGGARRWIRLFGFSLAPVEFFKIGFIYFLAWSFSRKFTHESRMSHLAEWLLALPYLVVFLIAVFLIAILQNDLGQVIVLGTTLAFMMFFAGRSIRFFTSFVALSLVLFVTFISIAEHRVLRMKLWWVGVQDYILSFLPASMANRLHIQIDDEPYQITHAYNAIYNGGIFGTGIGNGNFKLGFLSEVHTDFVLAGIAEETGLLGVIVVTTLFLIMVWRLFKIANRVQSRIFYLFGLGVGIMLAFSFLINSYGISGLAPIKGLSVPFVSYGGSALLGASIAIGLVLMISQRAKL
ncbi:MAG: cell division protein [Sulfuricurvum sp. PC08-66]|nr:MAG: cell division protein [Sulfuricurvum sp. PC08-66]